MLTTPAGLRAGLEDRLGHAAATVFGADGGKVLVQPEDIPIGRLAVVEPFGNQLMLLD